MVDHDTTVDAQKVLNFFSRASDQVRGRWVCGCTLQILEWNKDLRVVETQSNIAIINLTITINLAITMILPHTYKKINNSLSDSVAR